jgi:multiple antibiotic resistance protein
MTLLNDFLQVFLPLFVAIDAFGLVPLFLGVTSGMSVERRRRVTFEAVLVASIISISFMFIGQRLFSFLGITQDDFRIAGGILLLVLAVLDLLGPAGKPAVHEPEIVGIVPLGMPLIAGPATLTTALVLANNYGYSFTLFSLMVNFVILLVVMLFATRIERFIGTNALRAFSKLVMVLLAAIAVNFIRMGVTNVLAGR